MKQNSAPRGDIMIVDDNPTNLELLEEVLRQQGHEVRSFPLGRLALAAAMTNPPDLILLDVTMPEMSGYEVCERLKATGDLADIPVIFLSALNETQDKMRAFGSGAVDYVSKPFQLEEVRARVETHLQLHGLQQVLKLQNERLEEAVAARTLELAEVNRRLTVLDASKSAFLNLISHEFRTPLHGLLGVGALILEGMSATEENKELQGMFEHSRRRILSILDDALLLTEIDVNGHRFTFAPVSLHTVTSRAVEAAAELAASHQVTLAPPAPTGDFVLGDEDLLVRAVHALLEAAVKLSEKGRGVRITREAERDSLKVIIETDGAPVPASVLEKFFDLFAIGEAMTPGVSLGLGPAVAHRILSLFGASVGVADRDHTGIRLAISLKNALNHNDSNS